MAAEIHTYRVGAPEIELSVTVEGEGPAVLLLHGFPELGYSWRHQISALAKAGYTAIAPDQRGFGWSEVPDKVEDYDIFALTGDAIALLDHLEIEECVLVGHDWGSMVAAQLALFRPDRFRGVVLMSVPYSPRSPRSFSELIAQADPEGPFGYMVAFQDRANPVEDLMDADPIAVMRTMFWSVSGEEPDPAEPHGLPSFINEGEFENYCRAFARTGFGPGVNWYRNMGQNWEQTKPWHNMLISVPALFIGGSEDFVVKETDARAAAAAANTADASQANPIGHDSPMAKTFKDFRGDIRIEGAGHWVQQENPEAVNQALLNFLAQLP